MPAGGDDVWLSPAACCMWRLAIPAYWRGSAGLSVFTPAHVNPWLWQPDSAGLVPAKSRELHQLSTPIPLQCLELARRGLVQQVFQGRAAPWWLAHMWASAWPAYSKLAKCALMVRVLPEGPGGARTAGDVDALLLKRLAHTPSRTLLPIVGLVQEVTQACAMALHALVDHPWEGMSAELRGVYTAQAGSTVLPLLSMVLSPFVAMRMQRVLQEGVLQAGSSQPEACGQEAWVQLASSPGDVAPLLRLAESIMRLMVKREQLHAQLLAAGVEPGAMDRAMQPAVTYVLYILNWMAWDGAPLQERPGLFGGGSKAAAAQLAAARG